MNLLLKLEDAVKFIAAYALSIYFERAWWEFFAWLLVPDVSMIGYVLNTRTGAVIYNLVHHQGLALIVLGIGMYFGISAITFSGVILFGHSALDRMLGYGLKYPDNFKHTHLGWIGKETI